MSFMDVLELDCTTKHAKMLSIVPLIDGGGLFETGAGGSGSNYSFMGTNQMISVPYALYAWPNINAFCNNGTFCIFP